MKTVKAWAVVHRSTNGVCMCGSGQARIYKTEKDARDAGWSNKGAFRIVRVEIMEVKPGKRKS